MRIDKLFVPLVFACLITSMGSSQQSSPTDGQPETIEQALQRHHVPLTSTALLAALRDPDGEVRTLAAHKLALDGNKDAIPSIIEAMKAEKVDSNRVNIAFSAAMLGDPTGLTTLKDSCEDGALSPYLQMVAAGNLQQLHDDSCRAAVLRQLGTGDDADSLITAMSIALKFAHTSAQESEEIFRSVVKALANQTPGVRMTASYTLGRLGNPSAIPYLREALVKERNETCSLQMGMDLQRLQSGKQ